MADREHNASTLLLDEYFDAGDARFLDEVFACRVPNKLKALAATWYGDARPWAREQLLAYVADGCDRPGHRPLVKALFKLAEAAGDDEAMGRFLVAFDGLMRRVLAKQHRWDPVENQIHAEFVLRRDNSVPGGLEAATRAGRFSAATRRYLARRAFRYFRRLGYGDAARYGRGVRAALARYDESALDRPERLLDAWGLVHALYGASPVLDRDPDGVRLAAGRTLSELEPAPLHPTAWRGCFDDVLALVRDARSRTVRQWALALLERVYARELEALPLDALRALLLGASEEAHALGVARLAAAKDLDRLGVDAWLELLRVDNLEVAGAVADLAARHIDPSRLSLAECVALARAPLAPVAALGVRWLAGREIASAEDLALALELRDAPVATARAEAAAWLVSLLRTSPHATTAHARDLLDSRYPEVRVEGLGLLHEGSRFTRDLSLAAALAESPYADVRAWLVARLSEWEREVDPETLRHVWAAALLAVHRGSRLKRTVLEQIADRLAARPDEADLLVPVVAVALRSVRPAERRAALAAVAGAARRAPDLAAPLARLVPELKLEVAR